MHSDTSGMDGDQRRTQVLEYIPGAGPPESAARAAQVAYVGGPRGGEREERLDRPELIVQEDGVYRRGVSCADDRVLRYVWSSPGP